MNYYSQIFSRAVADELIEAGMVKVSSERDLYKLAEIADTVASHLTIDVTGNIPIDVGYEVADAIMKFAEETGSLVDGDNPAQENTAENAASQSKGLAALDQKRRPEGKHNVAVGDSKLNTSPGHVGKEEEHADGPGDEDAVNSVIEEREKNAAIQAILRKLSAETGAMITGDKPAQKNTAENAASQSKGLASLDQKERPEGKYLTGLGKTTMNIEAGSVGKEQPHPKSPGDETKSNSLTDMRKKQAYLQQFYRPRWY